MRSIARWSRVLPEKRRRFGIRIVPEAENEWGGLIEQTGCRNAHSEIGDHMAEMVTDRSAPDALVGALYRPIGKVRPRRPEWHSPPAVAGVDLHLETWPFRTAAKK